MLLNKMMGQASVVGKIVNSARNWEHKGRESKALAQKLGSFVLTTVDSGRCTHRVM